MHSTDDSQPIPEKKARWKKCPICWDSVYISETRPVAWYKVQNADMPIEGGDVVLRLVMRFPGSTLALPREGIDSITLDDDIPWYHIADVPDYARIMKGSEDYMTSQYDTEIENLQTQEREDELIFGDDTTWIRKAIASVKKSKEKVVGIGNPPTFTRQQVERRPEKEPITFERLEEAPDMYVYQHAVKSGQSSGQNPTPGSREPSAVLNPAQSESLSEEALSSAMSKLGASGFEDKRDKTSQEEDSHGTAKLGASGGAPHPPDVPFYFYQALPHFYLSSLDIRILKTAFGDYSQFPTTILPRIEHISTGHVVDEDLRKRTKYLGHLPFGCEVNFLECDWTDLVSQQVLDQFNHEINRRRKRNYEKATREEKDRIRAEKSEEDQRWATTRRKRSSMTSVDRPFSESDFQPLGLEGQAGSDIMGGMDTGISSASPPWSSSRGRNRPSFTALASPSGSPPGPRTVWGTTAIAPTSPQPAPQNPDDGWLQDWERDLLTEQHQLAAAGGNGDNATSGGKKKKNKKITLMSTTGRRAA